MPQSASSGTESIGVREQEMQLTVGLARDAAGKFIGATMPAARLEFADAHRQLPAMSPLDGHTGSHPHLALDQASAAAPAGRQGVVDD
ncbi:MAG TPA: hypothetical protein VGP14_04085, partial [Casimicrobiaceae bacterium]|nr:hypothetical protein [Casimicrobiaceae bacterium]